MRNFITNHGLVLVRMIFGADATVSEIARDVGIKEQAAYLIVRDLVKEGYLSKAKVGRENRYRVDWDKAFGFQALPGMSIRDIVSKLTTLSEAVAAAKSRVLLHIAEHPQSTVGKTARELRISTSEAQFALNELEKEGMVEHLTMGRSEGYTISPSVLPSRGRPLTIRQQVQLALNESEKEPMAEHPGRERHEVDYGLTLREMTVLQRVATGRTNNEIGRALGISTSTVQKHVASILNKMNVSSRTEAGVRALRDDAVNPYTLSTA